MRRDMDLIRRIALEVSDLPFGRSLTGLDGVEPEVFGTHVIWMVEAQLLDASISKYASGEPPKAHVHRLTWTGCEFADAARSDTVWAKAREHFIKPSASFTFTLVKDWLTHEISQGLPTIREALR
jgi:hypothetical protein